MNKVISYYPKYHTEEDVHKMIAKAVGECVNEKLLLDGFFFPDTYYSLGEDYTFKKEFMVIVCPYNLKFDQVPSAMFGCSDLKHLLIRVE